MRRCGQAPEGDDRRASHGRAPAGFTLLEVMLATAILAILAVGLMGAVTALSRLHGTLAARARTEASVGAVLYQMVYGSVPRPGAISASQFLVVSPGELTYRVGPPSGGTIFRYAYDSEHGTVTLETTQNGVTSPAERVLHGVRSFDPSLHAAGSTVVLRIAIEVESSTPGGTVRWKVSQEGVPRNATW